LSKNYILGFILKKLLLLLLLSQNFAIAAMVNTPSVCGEYNVAGIVRFDKIKNKIFVLVNEKSMSEQIMSFDLLETPKLTPFLNRPLTLSVQLLSKWDGNTGVATNIVGSPKDRIPNPMNPLDTGFELQKELPCIK
jgi:hypothetical protein